MVHLIDQLELVRWPFVGNRNPLKYLFGLRITLLGEEESWTLQETFIRERQGNSPNASEEEQVVTPSRKQSEQGEEDWRASPHHREHIDRHHSKPSGRYLANVDVHIGFVSEDREAEHEVSEDEDLEVPGTSTDYQ